MSRRTSSLMAAISVTKTGTPIPERVLGAHRAIWPCEEPVFADAGESRCMAGMRGLKHNPCWIAPDLDEWVWGSNYSIGGKNMATAVRNAFVEQVIAQMDKPEIVQTYKNGNRNWTRQQEPTMTTLLRDTNKAHRAVVSTEKRVRMLERKARTAHLAASRAEEALAQARGNLACACDAESVAVLLLGKEIWNVKNGR